MNDQLRTHRLEPCLAVAPFVMLQSLVKLRDLSELSVSTGYGAELVKQARNAGVALWLARYATQTRWRIWYAAQALAAEGRRPVASAMIIAEQVGWPYPQVAGLVSAAFAAFEEGRRC